MDAITLMMARTRKNHQSGTVTPPAGISLIQTASATQPGTVSSLNATLNSVSVGDVIVVVVNYGLSEPTWSMGASDSSGNIYNSLITQIGGGGAPDMYSFSTSSSSTGAITVSSSISGHVITGAMTVYQFRGATPPTSAACVSEAWTSLQASNSDPVTPLFSLSDNGIAVVACTPYIYGQNPTLNPIIPIAGTYTPDVAFAYSTSETLYSGHITGAGQQSSMSVQFVHNPSSSTWRATTMAIPVNPA